jgi:hypothetical protein
LDLLKGISKNLNGEGVDTNLEIHERRFSADAEKSLVTSIHTFTITAVL